MKLRFNIIPLLLLLLVYIGVSSFTNKIDYIVISGAPCTIDYHTWNNSKTIKDYRTDNWVIRKKRDFPFSLKSINEQIKVNASLTRIQPIYLIEIFVRKEGKKMELLVDRQGNIQYNDIVYFPIKEISEFLRSKSDCFLEQ